MNQKIKISEGIKYGIIGLALLVFMMIWPTHIIHKTEVSKSKEENLQVSDPISVENNGTQMFVAEGNYLDAVELYIANDMASEIITFRVYDGDYKQLWETFVNVDPEATFPSFLKIKIDMEVEEEKNGIIIKKATIMISSDDAVSSEIIKNVTAKVLEAEVDIEYDE